MAFSIAAAGVDDPEGTFFSFFSFFRFLLSSLRFAFSSCVSTAPFSKSVIDTLSRNVNASNVPWSGGVVGLGFDRAVSVGPISLAFNFDLDFDFLGFLLLTWGSSTTSWDIVTDRLKEVRKKETWK